MTEQAPKKKNWFRRIFTIVFCIGIMFAIVFTVLANIGGNSAPLRESIEQYLNESTPYKARVGTLNNMNFFPSIIIDFNNLELRPKEYVTGEASIRVSKVFMAASFWDVITRSGKLGAFHIANLNAQPGSLLKRQLSLNELSILTNAQGDAAILRGEGFVGPVPFFMSSQLEVFGKLPQQHYRIGDKKSVEAGLGDFYLSALAEDVRGEGIDLKNLILKKTDPVMSGHLELRSRDGGIHAGGELQIHEGETQIKPDLQINYIENGLEIKGIINAISFSSEDFIPDSALNEFVKVFLDSFELPQNKKIIFDVILQASEARNFRVTFENNKIALVLQ